MPRSADAAAVFAMLKRCTPCIRRAAALHFTSPHRSEGVILELPFLYRYASGGPMTVTGGRSGLVVNRYVGETRYPWFDLRANRRSWAARGLTKSADGESRETRDGELVVAQKLTSRVFERVFHLILIG